MKYKPSFILNDCIGLMVLFLLFFLMSTLAPFSIFHEPFIYAIYIFWVPCALFVWHHPEAPRKPIKWLILTTLSIAFAFLWYGIEAIIAKYIFEKKYSLFSEGFDLIVFSLISPGLTCIAISGSLRAIAGQPNANQKP